MSKVVILYKDVEEINGYIELLIKNGVLISDEDFVYIDGDIKGIEEIKPDKIIIPINEISMNNKEFSDIQKYNLDSCGRELHLTKLPVNKKGIVHFIDTEAILYMTTHDKETHIHTEDKVFTSDDSLKVMENRLVYSGFMRCHRSYIVNLNRVNKLVYWNNGVYLFSFKEVKERIPVSRIYYKQLKKALQL